MILSFHPIIEADKNLICAGRAPGAPERAAIQKAAAVIVPQGCAPSLYRMARDHCPHVFPNLDVRFDHPGKCGQVRLFRKLGIAHPPTRLYDSLGQFQSDGAAVTFPAVIKLDWGGQGETVFKAGDRHELAAALERVRSCEHTHQSGFIVQPYIPHRHRCLRVTVIGTRLIAYWRIQSLPGRFGTSVKRGARIDHHAEPRLQAAGIAVAQHFCTRTGLQLAGFDFIFDQQALDRGRIEPLMLEINYFFGRAGLGGSQAFYRILIREVDRWLAGLGLAVRGTKNAAGTHQKA
jgi:ribosomal protein S6--L-glutamate ligase